MDWIDRWLAEAGWSYMPQRDVWIFAMVNLTGFGVLIATAYIVGWFRRQPWRERNKPAVPEPSHQAERSGRAVPAE
jgi:hypothetical protein